MLRKAGLSLKIGSPCSTRSAARVKWPTDSGREGRTTLEVQFLAITIELEIRCVSLRPVSVKRCKYKSVQYMV